jgi:hypothetical protein
MPETAAARERTVYGETFLPRIHFNWSELRGAENAKYHFIDAPKPELYDVNQRSIAKSTICSARKKRWVRRCVPSCLP